MQTERVQDIMRMWNRASITNQHLLIQRFLKEKGRQNMSRDTWMKFLAQEFSETAYRIQHLKI